MLKVYPLVLQVRILNYQPVKKRTRSSSQRMNHPFYFFNLKFSVFYDKNHKIKNVQPT